MLRRERRISPPWLKSVTAVEGNNVPAPTKGASPPSYRKPLCPWATVFSSIFLEQQFSQITASVHPTRYLEVSREARRSALLPFSARATFHPDCTVGTGFSPVRPLLRAGVSSGVLASCVDAKIRTIFLPACESGSRAVTAGSEFHRPRSTMLILIMPQRTPGF